MLDRPVLLRVFFSEEGRDCIEKEKNDFYFFPLLKSLKAKSGETIEVELGQLSECLC